MSSRHRKWTAVAFLAALILMSGRGLVADEASGAADRPNVLIVLTDDQGWGDTTHRKPV